MLKLKVGDFVVTDMGTGELIEHLETSWAVKMDGGGTMYFLPADVRKI